MDGGQLESDSGDIRVVDCSQVVLRGGLGELTLDWGSFLQYCVMSFLVELKHDREVSLERSQTNYANYKHTGDLSRARVFF